MTAFHSHLLLPLAYTFTDSHTPCSVFIIPGCSTFVQFVQFTFAPHCAEYFDATNVTEQLNLINDPKKDTAIRMQRSKWFNLQTRKGFTAALCHVFMLLLWHEQRESTL